MSEERRQEYFSWCKKRYGMSHPLSTHEVLRSYGRTEGGPNQSRDCVSLVHFLKENRRLLLAGSCSQGKTAIASRIVELTVTGKSKDKFEDELLQLLSELTPFVLSATKISPQVRNISEVIKAVALGGQDYSELLLSEFANGRGLLIVDDFDVCQGAKERGYVALAIRELVERANRQSDNRVIILTRSFEPLELPQLGPLDAGILKTKPFPRKAMKGTQEDLKKAWQAMVRGVVASDFISRNEQETLAAQYLAAQSDILSLVEDRLHLPWWRETLVLTLLELFKLGKLEEEASRLLLNVRSPRENRLLNLALLLSDTVLRNAKLSEPLLDYVLRILVFFSCSLLPAPNERAVREVHRLLKKDREFRLKVCRYMAEHFAEQSQRGIELPQDARMLVQGAMSVPHCSAAHMVFGPESISLQVPYKQLVEMVEALRVGDGRQETAMAVVSTLGAICADVEEARDELRRLGRCEERAAVRAIASKALLERRLGPGDSFVCGVPIKVTAKPRRELHEEELHRLLNHVRQGRGVRRAGAIREIAVSVSSEVVWRALVEVVVTESDCHVRHAAAEALAPVAAEVPQVREVLELALLENDIVFDVALALAEHTGKDRTVRRSFIEGIRPFWDGAEELARTLALAPEIDVVVMNSLRYALYRGAFEKLGIEAIEFLKERVEESPFLQEALATVLASHTEMQVRASCAHVLSSVAKVENVSQALQKAAAMAGPNHLVRYAISALGKSFGQRESLGAYNSLQGSVRKHIGEILRRYFGEVSGTSVILAIPREEAGEVGLLIEQLLGSKNPKERLAAASELAFEVAGRQRVTNTMLLALEGEKDDKVKAALIVGLAAAVATDPKVEEALLGTLDGYNRANLRSLAARALGFGPPGPSMELAALAQGNHEKVDVRIAALRALGRRSPEEASEVALQLLDTPLSTMLWQELDGASCSLAQVAYENLTCNNFEILPFIDPLKLAGKNRKESAYNIACELLVFSSEDFYKAVGMTKSEVKKELKTLIDGAPEKSKNEDKDSLDNLALIAWYLSYGAKGKEKRPPIIEVRNGSLGTDKVIAVLGGSAEITVDYRFTPWSDENTASKRRQLFDEVYACFDLINKVDKGFPLRSFSLLVDEYRAISIDFVC